MLLLGTALTVGFVHTLLGPDHYLPFIVIGRARRWSLARTSVLTFVCGLGHVLSSVVLGLLGAALGLALQDVQGWEATRGEWAGWALLLFGAAYGGWGVWRALRGKGAHRHLHLHPDGRLHQHDHDHGAAKPHGALHDHGHVHAHPHEHAHEHGAGGRQGHEHAHDHGDDHGHAHDQRHEHGQKQGHGHGLDQGAKPAQAHQHSHDHDHDHDHDATHDHHVAEHGPSAQPTPWRQLTPWLLFTIFVLGPCEPLIPLFFASAVGGDWSVVLWASFGYGLATLVGMHLTVTLLWFGLRSLPLGPLERWSHALAGGVILLAGVSMVFLGL